MICSNISNLTYFSTELLLSLQLSCFAFSSFQRGPEFLFDEVKSAYLWLHKINFYFRMCSTCEFTKAPITESADDISNLFF